VRVEQAARQNAKGMYSSESRKYSVQYLLYVRESRLAGNSQESQGARAIDKDHMAAENARDNL